MNCGHEITVRNPIREALEEIAETRVGSLSKDLGIVFISINLCPSFIFYFLWLFSGYLQPFFKSGFRWRKTEETV